MTQPSTVNQTFDTSLIDVQKSFSSTETNTSGSSGKENMPPTTPQPQQQRAPSPYQSVSTEVLYDQWASTYDTDGNVLQAVDDIQMTDLLPELVRLTRKDATSRKERAEPLRVLDLGCGTGRNTVKLLQLPWQAEVDITGWDSSAAMLSLARTKCEAAFHCRAKPNGIGIELEQIDIATIDNVPARSENHFDALISTLVLEHIPLDVFFSIVSRVLKKGGCALISNMHPDMGALTRAGYKTASGERIKGASFVYGVGETVEAAGRAGLEVLGEVREREVSLGMLDGGVVDGVRVERGQVGERARKWIGVRIWYGMVLRKR